MDPSRHEPEAASAQPVPVIAVAATFTAEPLNDSLAFWMRHLGFPYEIRFAPYNQVFQQLLDPASLLGSNRGGFNVLLIRFEDWARYRDGAESGLAVLEENARRLVSSAQSQRSDSPLLLAICPASPGFLAGAEGAEIQRAMEKVVLMGLRDAPGVHLILPAEVEGLYPVREVHDPHGDELGHVPYTPVYFAALGTLLARRIHALRTTPYKVIALDCDETLWRGICGEDGPEGVEIDPPRRDLQDFMVQQHESGVLLALVSKNNMEDVIDTFRAHPEMPLRPEHFVSWRINWEPKAANLRALAEELELGLDSFILVDDNPKECTEVRASCPEVLALALPRDASEFPRFLRDVWAFDRPRVTEEDRRRTALYARRLERARAEKETGSLEEFLASLQLEVEIHPMLPEELPRVAQLTQRTNQMNFTTIRRSESEIRALVESGQAECWTVNVTDRFGSYGLTGVVIFTARRGVLAVDTFLLSCRVLGRGVEHRVLAALGQAAERRGLAFVDVPFARTPRNLPALLFLESVGLEFRKTGPKGVRFRFPAQFAARIAYKPDAAPRKQPAPAPAVAEGAPGRKPIDYASIAAELHDPEVILKRIRSETRGAGPSAPASAAPRTDLERRLAEIWAETLGLPSVGIHDNFFDLGGHSLLAVELLSRVRKALDVDLSLEVVYTGDFTVAELAKAIEVKEIEQAGVEQYAALLEELEGLSDEEVRALLDKETREPR